MGKIKVLDLEKKYNVKNRNPCKHFSVDASEDTVSKAFSLLNTLDSYSAVLTSEDPIEYKITFENIGATYTGQIRQLADGSNQVQFSIYLRGDKDKPLSECLDSLVADPGDIRNLYGNILNKIDLIEKRNKVRSKKKKVVKNAKPSEAD